MDRKTVVSAALSFLIAFGTSTMALLVNAQTFAEVSGPAIALALLGACVSVSKDVLSSLRDPNA
jgi:hypothetical protein